MFKKVPKEPGQLTGCVTWTPDKPISGVLRAVLFLHGLAERGDGTQKGLQGLENFIASEYNKIKAAMDWHDFIIIAPQLPTTEGNWQNQYVEAGLTFAQTLPVDWERLSIMGISLGGGGVWKYITASIDNAKKFSAAVVICGVGGWGDLKVVADAQLPVWAFHANDDTTVGVGFTNSAISGINQYNPPILARKTIYPTGGHYIWGQVCDPTRSPGINGEIDTIWTWMGKNTNTKHVPVETAPNTTPILIADAGPDITVTGTTATLDGGASKGYKSAWWTQESFNGKWDSGNYFAGSNFGIKAGLKGLKPGEYQYKLVVADGTNMVSDTVKVIVTGTKKPKATVFFDDGSVGTAYDDKTWEVK